MENKTGQYPEIKKNADVFTAAENNFGTQSQSTDEYPDCWSDLWQRMKAQGARFLKINSKKEII